jgi:hypothetical protein
MSNHNPKRFLFAGLTAIAVAGAAFLAPSVASADGGPRPQPHGVFIGGGATTGAIIGAGAGAAGGYIWVPQGSPVVEREQLGAVRRFVDAPGGVLN